VLGAPLQQLGESASFSVLRVLSIGVNNMPPATQNALAELFGPIPELLEEFARADMPDDIELTIAQARETGYANCFSAVATDIIWRPPLAKSDGATYSKPVAFGAQSAVVVGADGNDKPSGADELYCDKLGRVRIRFHWQDGGNANCWVRVAQRSAGGGMGQQFLPRIGQEVLVQFLENDIDRPVVVGALYNGQGEGGVAATPGGRRDKNTDLSCFEAAHDYSPSGQANLSGGNSPAWHGASEDTAGHRNPTSEWGIRTKEFGSHGYSQLLFDDVDGQGRVQLKSGYASSELNLGHILHIADNYRGSFRGAGSELRTDAYGTVRAASGLLLSSFRTAHNTSIRDSAGDNSAGVALMKQLGAVMKPFGSAADTHQTVAFATLLGTSKSNASVFDNKAPPLSAMLTSTSGMVDRNSHDSALADVHTKNTSASDDKVPHLCDPLVAISAKNSYAMNAGQSLQLSNGDAAISASGRDTQFVAGGQMREHTRQAIGILGGAIKESDKGQGVELVAAKDAIDVSAQGDHLSIQARDDLKVISLTEHADWASAKSVILSTLGGATIKIGDGNILIQCPGKLNVHAGKKSFNKSAKISYPLPAHPTSICVGCLIKARNAGSPFVMRSA